MVCQAAHWGWKITFAWPHLPQLRWRRQHAVHALAHDL